MNQKNKIRCVKRAISVPKNKWDFVERLAEKTTGGNDSLVVQRAIDLLILKTGRTKAA